MGMAWQLGCSGAGAKSQCHRCLDHRLAPISPSSSLSQDRWGN